MAAHNPREGQLPGNLLEIVRPKKEIPGNAVSAIQCSRTKLVESWNVKNVRTISV